MDEIHDAFQSGRLACPIPSDEAHDLPWLDIERDILEGKRRILLADVLDP
jgi:hypothetical protein